jgi:hypothetical protein
MKLSGVGTRRQALTLAALAGLLALFVVRWATVGAGASAAVAGPGTSSRPASIDPDETGTAPRGRGGRAREVGPDEVPALSSKDLAPQKPEAGDGTGRDLFDFRVPTPTPPPPPPATMTPVPVCGQTGIVGPCATATPVPPTATPSPPEIGFKVIGIFGPKDDPIAVLVQGDKIVNARTGDVVFDRFQVVRVGHESVDIGFVPGAWQWKETRRLAIVP